MSSIAGHDQLARTTAVQATQAPPRARSVAPHGGSGARRALSSLLATWRRGAELSRAIDEAKDTARQAPDGPSHRLLG
ncbi:MAG: hypothetical protein HOQ07_08165 [Sinomonas sp.]|nr:hypothetical protein [Sinomonas sp.]